MLTFLQNPEIQVAFLEGLRMTLILFFAGSMLALALGFFMAFARTSHNKFWRKTAGVYVELFRNTPLLIQLYLYYRGLQSLGILLAPETCAILALGLYTGAYMTEVFRAGLLGVPREQFDSGLSLGLNRFQVYTMILIPQAFRLVLPPLTNQLISLAKNSSLAAFITVNELFRVIYSGAVDKFQPVEYFLVGAALYLMVSLAIAGAVALLDYLLYGHRGDGLNWLKRMRHAS